LSGANSLTVLLSAALDGFVRGLIAGMASLALPGGHAEARLPAMRAIWDLMDRSSKADGRNVSLCSGETARSKYSPGTGEIDSAMTFDSRMHVACDCSRALARVFQHPPGNISKGHFCYRRLNMLCDQMLWTDLRCRRH